MKPAIKLPLLGLALAALSVPQLVHAASTYYWDTTTTGLWSTGANWSNNATSGGTTGTAPSSSDSVVFNQSSINGNEVVQVDANQTIAGMTFANTGTTLLESNNSTPQTLGIGSTFTVNSGAGAVTIGNATNILNVALAQSAGTAFTLNSSSNVTFINTTTQTASGSNIAITVNGVGSTLTFGNYNLGNAGTGKTLTLDGTANVQINGTLADNSTTASVLNYNGTGKLTLSGAATYTGKTTIGTGTSASTMQFAKEVSLYNGNTASWTTSNIRVNAGATMAFNVGGTGEFTASDIQTLTGLGTSTGGFTNNSIIGLDTTNASGGVFTYNNAIAPSRPGVGLTKLGANTLVLAAVNTYTGKTTISAGTLALGVNNALSASTAITLGGGALSLGGFSQAAFTNALTMTASSTIDFGSHVGGLTLKFGDSSAATWTGTLSLLNFTVGTDNLSFTSMTGLTVAELAQISLAGYTATGLDSNGNVQFTASAIPEPATYAAIFGACVLGLAAGVRRFRAVRR